MTLHPHRVPDEVFTALARGAGGGPAARFLAAVQRSRLLLLLRGVVVHAAATGHPGHRAAADAYELLADLQDTAPHAVDAVLRHPSVGAWAYSTVRALARGRRTADPGRLAGVAAAAAIRAGVRRAIPVGVAAGGTIVLPSLGRISLPSPPATAPVTIRTSHDGAEVDAAGGPLRVPADPWRDAPGWQGLRRLSARAGDTILRLTVDDLDPYRMPGMDNLAPRLSADEARDWSARLQDAWEMLVAEHWTAAEELRTLLRAMTPLRRPAEGVVSATARESFGCVGLSTPPDGHALAETLAHELQHAKLTTLLEVTTLVAADDGTRYYAPWRDDPRPAGGLLQGAYAYLGVAGFWRRRRERESGPAAGRAHAAFARWRDAACSVTETLLASGRLTPAGEEFVCGMRGTLRAWRDEPVPHAALARARGDAERHMSHWRRRNGAALVRPAR